MKTLLTTLIGVTILILTGCGEPAIDPDRLSETARLNEWFDDRFEESLDFSPMQKTRLGRKDDYDQLDDVSEAAQDLVTAWSRQAATGLRDNFDYDLLTPEAQISYDLWIFRHEQAEASLPFRRRHYLFHQMSGRHTGLPQFLINYHRVDEESDMVAYVARIGEAARVIDQAVERATLAAAEGVHAPRFAYEAVIQQATAVITGTPFDPTDDATAASPLWADATTKIEALVENDIIDTDRAQALRTDTEAALTDRLRPAYDALIAWAESELAKTDDIATGVWNRPDGPAFYAQQLAAMTTTDMTADEIHALGLSEVERIQAEMEAIKQQVGFEGSLSEFFAYIRQDPQFVLPNTDEGRATYLQTARDHLDGIEQRLPDYFGLLPAADLVVRRVESFREQPGGAQHYARGAPDGSRPGVYYAHLIDMNAMPIPDLEVVAYHEGLPGHHMQLSIAQELTGIPLFRRQAGFTAYTEGWGLYSEWLAQEMGAYADPYSNFGRLSGEIWRAIRLVVDTGLHAKSWTEAEAVEYFMATSAVSEGQIRSEVQRYIVWPGQATAYKVGMLKIQELRARAEEALGQAFDIRAFHDTVLGGGALPLSILERRIDEWIARERAD